MLVNTVTFIGAEKCARVTKALASWSVSSSSAVQLLRGLESRSTMDRRHEDCLTSITKVSHLNGGSFSYPLEQTSSWDVLLNKESFDVSANGFVAYHCFPSFISPFMGLTIHFSLFQDNAMALLTNDDFQIWISILTNRRDSM
jgi:hypothetical protein